MGLNVYAIRSLELELTEADIRAFDEFESDLVEKYSRDDYSMHTTEHLRKFFDICAERGLGLAGDW